MTLKAVAYASGVDPSPVGTGHYWITGAVAVGTDHAIGLKTDGTAWTWGLNSYGPHCDGTTSSGAPAQISGLSGVVAVDAYGFSNCAWNDDGEAARGRGNGTLFREAVQRRLGSQKGNAQRRSRFSRCEVVTGRCWPGLECIRGP
jgi:alpha-tubulin suppressor-like RCC1 family protein